MAFEDYKGNFKFDVVQVIESTHGTHWNDLSNIEQDQVLQLARQARCLEMQTSLSEFLVHRLNFKFSLEDENPKVLFRVFANSYQFPNKSKRIHAIDI